MSRGVTGCDGFRALSKSGARAHGNKPVDPSQPVTGKGSERHGCSVALLPGARFFHGPDPPTHGCRAAHTRSWRDGQ
jgi:hypothetical protein